MIAVSRDRPRDSSVIHVDVFPPAAVYDTIDAAVEAGTRAYQESLRANESLTGARIVDIAWSDTEAVFRLSNGRSVRLFCSPHGVEWSIEHTFPEMQSHDSLRPRQLLLQFANSGNIVEWNRAGLLEQRLGRTFERVVIGGFGPLVYVQDCMILLFMKLTNVATGAPLLHWDETD